MGCIISVIKGCFKIMFLILRLLGKVFIFLMFRLGLVLVAVYAGGMHILDKFIFDGRMDIYGKNLGSRHHNLRYFSV